MRRLPFILLLAAAAAAQPAGPRFDAVSIHELESPYRVLGQLTVSGSLVKLEGYTVGMMVAAAYAKERYQTATPPPKHFAYFTIEARAPGDAAPQPAALQAMLRNMLAERFRLKAHKEMRNVPVYALEVSKGGPRLKISASSGNCRQVSGPVIPTDRNYRIFQENCPIDTLIRMIGADRPVIDRTGLTGLYDVSIFYTPDFRMKDGNEPGDISILDSVHQLGLQLEKRDELMEVVVV
ncbi:MAG TPA: TIGR03435 family protein, partial [Bryobacteraceae bacterium]|nr:TIGR03435 family protein [Bryobacteraceae bacterium]